jgi:hypothetical protein
MSLSLIAVDKTLAVAGECHMLSPINYSTLQQEFTKFFCDFGIF